MRRPRRGHARAAGRRRSTLTGRISRSQLVSTFGVGSLYELRTYSTRGQSVTSVIIAGLDAWEKCIDKFNDIREPVLEHALNVGYFVEPPGVSDEDSSNHNEPECPSIPVYRFPHWLVCSECERLGVIGKEFRDQSGKANCSAAECIGHGIPVRLVTTCFHRGEEEGESEPHPGHLDDFPWNWWAHSKNIDERACKGKGTSLKLVRSGNSAGLAGLKVVCQHPECKKIGTGRSLEGVFGDKALHLPCRGKRPWLGDEEKCDRPVRALMRGASNVYFPVVASALSIPPNSSVCQSEVGSMWRRTLKPILDSGPKRDIDLLVRVARNASAVLHRFSKSQVRDAILEQLDEGRQDRNLPDSEALQRALERVAIIEERSDCSDRRDICLFDAERIDDEEISEESEPLHSVVEHLVLLHRLREVRALRGFQRLSPAASGDSYNLSCAPLSKNAKNWLPAITVQGEGVYIELRPELVRKWARSEATKKRFNVLKSNYHRLCRERGNDPDNNIASPGLVLIHTLAHLLINQLSLDCGYSSSSLRERIYVQTDDHDEDWYGLLIYTASTSSDGTLGGLVRQGEPDLFARSFEAAVTNAAWCSSDPLCIESNGQGVDALNLAACHACCIVSETSCEYRNLFLDRGLLVGTPDNPDAGFFHGVFSE